MSHCRGYGCASTELIHAHLTPQSFGRLIQGTSGPNILVSRERYTKRIPHGLFDRGILCERCDGILNTRYDDPAFEFFTTFSITPTENRGPYFEKLGVDLDLLCGFVLSILWRYSISKLPDTSEVNLGPYRDRAREVLWGMQPLSSFPEFQVFCQRYNKGPVDTEKMYSSPVDMKGEEFNSYGFSLLGFHFLAKVDQRPFHPVYRPFVLNGNSIFRVPFIDFQETPHGRGAKEMLAAARARRARNHRSQ
jgi:hypothetical protein